MLGHQKHVVLEQCTLHLLALPGLRPLRQSRHGADGTEHAAHDVVHAGTGAQRVAGAAGHIGQAAHHLHHFVQRGAVVIGAGQKTFVADVNQARVQGFQTDVVQPQFGHGAGLKVLADDVCRGYQAERGLVAFRRQQIERQAFFVAVEHGEKA